MNKNQEEEEPSNLGIDLFIYSSSESPISHVQVTKQNPNFVESFPIVLILLIFILFDTGNYRNGFLRDEEEATSKAVHEAWNSCKFEERRNGREAYSASKGDKDSTFYVSLNSLALYCRLGYWV